MADPFVVKVAIADIRDAIARIREVLPPTVEAFERDRSAREIVVLNLFVALQHCLSVANHWLADSGRKVPAAYRDSLLAMGELGMLEPDLARRLATASGLRNLIAHRYGVIDWRRIHKVAANDLGDLDLFCTAIENAGGR
ncbi:MAG: DUF86 domain-containing protein [Planctomycetota bacterium]